MRSVKIIIALAFVAILMTALAGRAMAYPPFLAKAKKFGAKDCTFCHVDPEGGPPWNERGKWLVAEKERRKADAVDVEWLADYKPGAASKKDDKTPKTESAGATGGGVQQELIGLLNQLIEAAKKRDASVFGRLLGDDFSEINAEGILVGRADVLAAIPQFNVDSYVVSETSTKTFGDSAILTYRVAIQGTFQGQNVGGDFRETQVWVKRGGKWQVVAAHITRVGAKTTGAATQQSAPKNMPDVKGYDAYVGEYELPVITLKVTREGDKLYGQPPDDTKEELVPISDEEFSITNVNAKIRFLKDPRGRVTGMKVDVDGQQYDGKKIR